MVNNSVTTKNGAVRKIKNGRVKIAGKYYEPQRTYQQYDGRLDGLWYLFGRYNDTSKVVLIGSLDFIRFCEENEELSDGELSRYFNEQPELVEVLGVKGLPWQFWREVGSEQV